MSPGRALAGLVRQPLMPEGVQQPPSLPNRDNLRWQNGVRSNRMKNKINIKSLLLGVALGAVVVFSLGAATGQNRIEYRHLRTEVSDESLNKLADEGWTVLCAGTSQNGGFYLLTRTRR